MVQWPDKVGNLVPLVYLNKDDVDGDDMRSRIQQVADERKIYFELREYQLVENSTEEFYPALKEYNA
jgi:hypothetical protein